MKTQIAAIVVALLATAPAQAYNNGNELLNDIQSNDPVAQAAAKYWINGVVNGVMMATRYEYKCESIPRHLDAVRRYLTRNPGLRGHPAEGLVVQALWESDLCPSPLRLLQK